MPSASLTSLAAAVLRVPGSPERILEIECGDGEGVLFLAREYPSARVRGVDRSEERIREAVARIGLDPEGRVAFKPGRGRSLPYPDDFFDLVAQVGGRLHPRELARVLRPGGHLILVGWSKWPHRRLGRRRFALIEAGEAGGEPFALAQLAGGD